MISYWDTSALIPCFVSEIGTNDMLTLLQEESDSVRYTSWLTLIEFEGVLRRKLNQKSIDQGEYESIQDKWTELQNSFNFIPLDSRTARIALRFQKLYLLRPYDSIQLGCAALIQLDNPDLNFVCLDEKLCRLAKQEGMKIK